MAIKRANREITKSGRFTALSAAGSSRRKITASMVPVTIKGILFPAFVSTLSDRLPNSGSKNSASTLSAAIITPVTVSPIPKVPCKMSGIILSYICQKAEIDKNASPIKNVLL